MILPNEGFPFTKDPFVTPVIRTRYGILCQGCGLTIRVRGGADTEMPCPQCGNTADKLVVSRTKMLCTASGSEVVPEGVDVSHLESRPYPARLPRE